MTPPGRSPGQPLVTSDVRSDLVAIYRAINEHDPHYRYEIAVSQSAPFVGQAQPPGLVAVAARREDAVWVITNIFARSLAAMEERPVPIELQLSVPADNLKLRDEVQRFIDYGAPLEMPPGTVRGTFDLPGDLGGVICGGSLQVTSVVEGQVDTDETEMRLGVLGPDRDVLAELIVRRTEMTSGESGVRTVWEDAAGLLSVEMLAAAYPNLTMKVRVIIDLNGRKPAEVAESMDFLAVMHRPNYIGFTSAYGPRQFDTTELAMDQDRDIAFWAGIARALISIQDHTTHRLLMPEQLTRDQSADIKTAAALLAGEPVSCPWDKLGIDLTTPAAFAVDDVLDFCVIVGLGIELDGEEVAVGQRAAFLRGRVTELESTHALIKAAEPDANFVLFTGDIENGRVFTETSQHQAR